MSLLIFLLVPITLFTILISGLTLMKACKELEDMNVKSNKFSKHLYPSWWSNFLIAGLWRFVSIISAFISIVVLLFFLWLHLLYQTRFGRYELLGLNFTKFDFLIKASNLEDPIHNSYYLYVLPLIFFIIPVIVNIWTRYKYLGFHDEYSVAIGILSAVIPIRYVI